MDYRVLALSRLLRDFDVRSFTRYCASAGAASLSLLQRSKAGAAFPEKYLCVSKDRGFAASLASGDFETARQIAEASPQAHYGRFEYEDDFLYGHFLRRAFVAGEEEEPLTSTLTRWEEVLEGAESVRLDVCKALLGHDAAAFASHFDLFLDDFDQFWAAQREATSYSATEDAAEGQISLEALAILQIAELRGIPTQGEYRFAPSIARVRPGDSELSYDWRAPAL
jgi:hypothetical protein